jgi:predicted aminopeptidase
MNNRKIPWVNILFSLLSVVTSTGCSPGYVMRAAYEQSKILLARRPIQEVIHDATTPEDVSKKLALVLEARAFASEIGLDPGDSFTRYADVGKDTLAWVVMGSRKDSFSVYSWWFPIVGSVPYKGFFDREGAREQAQELQAAGYEVSVRGTEAFSTLGWFNDPVMSTTLRNSPTRIVNTVLHESVHSTVWIPDHVSFNESLAHFVGSRATVSFYKKRAADTGSVRASNSEGAAAFAQAEQDYQFSMEFADYVSSAFGKLDGFYRRQDLTSEQKVLGRQRVFDEVMAPFRRKYPQVAALKELNNADLLQSKIYMTELRLFEQLYKQSDEVWSQFLARITELKTGLKSGQYHDPFEGLRRMARRTEQSATGAERPSS